MSRTPVIVDTNVVVAGLLSADPALPVVRILDGMLDAAFAFVVSPALLAEYRAVLLRPKLRKQHGLTPDEVDAVLLQIARHAIVLEATPQQAQAAPRAPDRGDQLLYDLIACRPDLLLVTGDERLLDDAAMRKRVMTPRAQVGQQAPRAPKRIRP